MSTIAVSRFRRAAAAITALWLIPVGPAAAEKRVALIVGNSSYVNVTRLDNPRHDAVLIAKTLGALGFQLVGDSAQLDLEKPALDRAVQAFGHQIQGADVALFYYAGHGVQIAGSNYLVPVNANPTREADVDFQMVDVNLVLRQMQGSGTRLNMVILDACRNNPFGGRGLRSSDGGLAQMRAPEGTLISYATQPGSVAQDGADGHSPYTRALAATVRRAGLDIFQTFNQVGLAVKRSTGGAQQPWVSSSPIDGTFYFVPPAVAAPGPPSPTAPLQQEARLSAAPRLTDEAKTIADPVLLKEIADRLYELNFDPEVNSGKSNINVAVREFQSINDLPKTGEPTEGLLRRLRETRYLGPWGSIVYGAESGKWGLSWGHLSRKEAVADARAKCGVSKCPIELSFYGKNCGAFAASGKQWSMMARDTIDKAKLVALNACSKSGKSCSIVGATCADGSGLPDQRQ